VPFFDIPSGDALSGEVASLLAQYARDVGHPAPPSFAAWAAAPQILEARVLVQNRLLAACRFSPAVKNIAFMLIAHRARCRVCFAGSRRELDKLGFDGPTLDSLCAHPETLPLSGRDRAFVEFAIRVATEPEGLARADFEAVLGQGLSREEIMEAIGFAAFANFQMTFTKISDAWLPDK
jgi:alkylhydroperoxidase family enzyme